MSSASLDLVGIGNAIMDFQVEVPFELVEKLSLTPGSMNLVSEDEIQSIYSETRSLYCKQSSGGSGANTCIALAELGHNIGYACIVGDDEEGKQYSEELKKIGVKLFNPPIGGGKTGKSLVFITPDAERTMNTCLGITSTFGPEHLNEEAIASSAWLYVEGYLFSSDTGREAVTSALKIAKESNTKVAMTFSDGFIVDCFKDAVTECAKESELIFANAVESTAFTGKQTVEEAVAELKQIAPKVVVTQGEKGAVVSYNDNDFSVDSFHVYAVDDTGAGDSFAAGFLSGEIAGDHPYVSATRGCFLASRVVSQVGARLQADIQEVLRSDEYQKRLDSQGD